MFENASIDCLCIICFLEFTDVSLALISQECPLEYGKHVRLFYRPQCLLFDSDRNVSGVQYFRDVLGSGLSTVSTMITIPLFVILENGKLRGIALYPSLKVGNRVVSTS